MRLDAANDRAPFASPRLAARLDLAGGRAIRLAAGRSFRPPSFDDLFFPDVGGALGNPDLRPERALEVELGLSQTIGRAATLAASLFWREIDDLIDALIMADQAERLSTVTGGDDDA